MKMLDLTPMMLTKKLKTADQKEVFCEPKSGLINFIKTEKVS